MAILNKGGARMKAGSGRRGFAMLEAMAAVAVLMAVAASVLASVSAVNRREIRKIEKDEAYDAALAAVRLMADEVMEGGTDEDSAANVLAMENGLTAREAEIVITPKDGSEPFSVPVTVRTERDDSRLILYAESVVGGQRKMVSLTLEALEEVEMSGEQGIPKELDTGVMMLATPSSAVFPGHEKWRIVRYNKVK